MMILSLLITGLVFWFFIKLGFAALKFTLFLAAGVALCFFGVFFLAIPLLIGGAAWGITRAVLA